MVREMDMFHAVKEGLIYIFAIYGPVLLVTCSFWLLETTRFKMIWLAAGTVINVAWAFINRILHWRTLENDVIGQIFWVTVAALIGLVLGRIILAIAERKPAPEAVDSSAEIPDDSG